MTHGLGIIYMIFFKHIVTKEEMQPDEEVTKKILYWVEKLGLDQVRRIMSIMFFFFLLTIVHAICFCVTLQSTWDEPKGKRK